MSCKRYHVTVQKEALIYALDEGEESFKEDASTMVDYLLWINYGFHLLAIL